MKFFSKKKKPEAEVPIEAPEKTNEDEVIDEAEDTVTILSKYVNSLNIDDKKELDNLLVSLYNVNSLLYIL